MDSLSMVGLQDETLDQIYESLMRAFYVQFQFRDVRYLDLWVFQCRYQYHHILHEIKLL